MQQCFKCQNTGFVKKRDKVTKFTTNLPCKVCKKRNMKAFPFDYLSDGFVCDNREFVVVGAGIAGLAVGIILKKLGCQVVILEKDMSFEERKQGYGLTMQQGSSTLRELGVELPKDTVSTSHYVFNQTGSILGYFGSNFSKYFEKYLNGESFPEDAKYNGKYAGIGRYNIHIPRQRLRKLLLEKFESLAPDSIKWGFSLSKLEPEDEDKKITLTSSTNNTIKADMVLACDGIYSKVSKLIFRKPLEYLQCVVILGVSDFKHPLLPKRVFETNDGETRLYVMPFQNFPSYDKSNESRNPGLIQLHDYTTMWQLSFKIQSQDVANRICATKETLLSEATNRCNTWHSPIPDLISHTKHLSGHPVYDRPFVKHSELQRRLESLGLAERLCLLGDAAHPMSPFKGQGANQALLDASLFGHTILNNESVETYHEKMIQRSRIKVQQSKQSVDDLHCVAATTPGDLCRSSEIDPCSQSITEHLNKLGINAQSSEEPGVELDRLIVRHCGSGNKPHRLHMDKVEKSRN